MKLRKFSEMNYINEGLTPEQLRELGVDPRMFEDDAEEVEFEEIEEETDTIDPKSEELVSNIRKMLKSAYDRSYVYAEERGAVGIQFILNKTENIAGIMNVMNILKGLKDDILIEYNTEFELWKTTKDDPMITVTFTRDEGIKFTKKVSPF